jgi:ankyrin repeat protein
MGHSELFQACYENNLSRVKELLDHGADPNLQEPHYGWTALIRAAYRGCTDIVRLLLLDRRTDPNLRDGFGSTALMIASHYGHIVVVKLLEAFAGWNRNVAQPLMNLGIFPEGLIREHLTV